MSSGDRPAEYRWLPWPPEGRRASVGAAWSHAGSNICLDLHGDPTTADLVVYSDGNHHMALAESLDAFVDAFDGAPAVFYVTTPPRVVVEALRSGRLRVGNLDLSTRPHLFISPARVLDPLVDEDRLQAHSPLARSRGMDLLVERGNPRGIRGVADLARDDVRLFISNPITEAISYNLYAESLRHAAAHSGVDLPWLQPGANAPARILHGASIHHREAPHAVAGGLADVAIVFSHLALRYTRIFSGRFESIAMQGSGMKGAVGDIAIALTVDPG
ncbi:MAG: substrate-binding domain-containing protein, partial [Vicinamibacterales bacterium]